ncbi:MAG: nicotinate-nucleotide adenylyltransferase [Aggregatilineales bacterium]
MTERLGLFGGTFDPPHLGHLILAECAIEALALSQVVFVLAADPPHKRDQRLTPAEHRLTMLELAIADNPHFALSRIDLDRPGPHYSVDTVRIAQTQYPGAALFFLMGGDSLHDLPTWHDPAGLVAQATLGVAHRPGESLALDKLVAQLPGLAGHVAFVEAPEIGISATDLRQRAQAGRSVRYQTPDVVRAYIQQHHLYED